MMEKALTPVCARETNSRYKGAGVESMTVSRGKIAVHRKLVVLMAASLVIVLGAGCASWFRGEEDRICPVVPEGTTGVYGTRLPAADGPGRIIRLRLKPNKTAELLTDYLNEKPAIIENGTWAYLYGRKVRVTLTGNGKRTYEKPQSITFAVDAQGLVAVKYDRDVWGEAGLSLMRNPPVSRPVWRLIQIRYPDRTAVSPEDPAKYVLVLSDDGTVTVLADCNRGMGTYLLAGSALVMEGFAYTHRICPENSLFDAYTNALAEASSCMLRDGHLHILFRSDLGTMEFEQAFAEE